LPAVPAIGPAPRPSRVELATALSVSDVVRTLREDRFGFALVGAWAGGGALVGSDPVRVAVPPEDAFELLDGQEEIAADWPGFVGGGWFGHLGYQLGSAVERLPPPPPRRLPLPAFCLSYHDHVVRRDLDGRWWFEALETGDRVDALAERLELWRARLAGPPNPPGDFSCGTFAPRPGAVGHARAVARCREYIAAGDIYQANLCLALEATLRGDPVELFVRARDALEAPYAALLTGSHGSIASMSPELFLRRRGRKVLTAPIKGTAQRPERDEPAAGARHALEASAKNRAENVMIVDLMRNDLGRVCRPASVRVTRLAQAEPHPGLWHLVSEVEGELADGIGDGALVRAAFPPGSVTGAPKIRAMEIVSELESVSREVYTGAIGYASPCAGLELSVAIRTFEISAERIVLGAGGGVVADSDPDDEYAECLHKARPLLTAVGARLSASAAPVRHPRLLPAPLRASRPDPAAGVFETMLVDGGEAMHADLHLARIARSVQALWGVEPQAEAVRALLVDAAARCTGSARVRLDAALEGDELAWTCRTTPLGPAGRPPVLVPVVVPGGLGPHKWRDRRLAQAAEREAAAVSDGVPLFVDLDGMVLETSRANVFVWEGDALLTPPADGSILPGTMRAAVMDEARAAGLSVDEVDVDLDRVAGARSVLLTNALRGARPAGGLAGHGAFAQPESRSALVRALAGLWQPFTTGPAPPTEKEAVR
jgi:para-aminobenzoate synthetase/4-amino-4-deoxychorismate lyase